MVLELYIAIITVNQRCGQNGSPNGIKWGIN